MATKNMYWIGRTAISSEFGRVFHGRKLDVTPDQARRFAKDLSDERPVAPLVPEDKKAKRSKK